MLLCLLGSPCAGKDTIASILSELHSFTRVRVGPSSSLSSPKSGCAELSFETPEAFLEYATLNWLADFVTTDLDTREDVEPFVKRPWFLAVGVEAGLIERWRRAVQTASNTDSPAPALESFVATDDLAAFGSTPVLLPPGSRTPSITRPVERRHLQIPSGSLPPSSVLLPYVDPNPTPPAISQPDAFGLTPPQLTRRRSRSGKDATPLREMMRFTSYTIMNTTPSLVHLRSTLGPTINHLRSLLRPSWDTYFMSLAGLASLRSNCMKRRVGAVLVSQKDRKVISTGYNGCPRGMRNCAEGGCARCNGTLNTSNPEVMRLVGPSSAATAVAKCGVGLNECLCLHAEENALLEAGRDRAGAGDGSTLYCNTCPCLRCSVKIVQCGVKEVVYALGYSMDEGTAAIFTEAGILLRQIKMPGE